jgi:hypothetical protein
MGKVICERHGAHVGVLACPHVSEAVRAKTLVPVGQGNVVLDVHTFAPLRAVLCSGCIEAFGIDPDEVNLLVTDEDFNRLPEAAPICGGCLAEYRKSTVG